MKKIFLVFLFALFAFTNSVFAADWTTAAAEQRVNTIGQNIMKKNGLPANIKFIVIDKDEQNAYANFQKEVNVYTGLLKLVENDDELAAVISHEIGHILNNHIAKQTMASSIATGLITVGSYFVPAIGNAIYAERLADLKMSRNEESEADITGVDLMVNAGYKPQAMISLLYKLGGAKFDLLSTHPSADKRTMYAYNYITYNYTNRLVTGYSSEYYNKFMEYATPIIAERNANSKKLASFQKSQEKLKQQRIKNMKKYQSKHNNTGWDLSYPLFAIMGAL